MSGKNKKIKYPDEFVESMDKYVERLPLDDKKKDRLSKFLHKSSGNLLDIETAASLIYSWAKENVPEKSEVLRDETISAVKEARKLSKNLREKRILKNTKKLYDYDENLGNVKTAVSTIRFSDEIIKYADAFSKREYFGSTRERYKDDLKQIPSSIIRSFSKSEGILRGHLEMVRTVKTLKKGGEATIYDPLLPLLSMNNDKFKDQFLLNLHSFIRDGGHLDLILEADCVVGPFEQLKFFLPIILSDSVTIYMHNEVKNHDRISFFIELDRIFGYGTYSENERDSAKGNIIFKKMLLSKVKECYEEIRKTSSFIGETFLPDRRANFFSLISKKVIFDNDFTMYKASLPLCTMHEKLLKRVLTDNGVSEENIEFILKYRKFQKKNIQKIIEKHNVTIFIPDFENDPDDKLYKIDLSDILFPNAIFYKKEDFLKHLRWTLDFAEENQNFNLNIAKTDISSNVEATLIGKECLIITKPRDPAMHLVIQSV